MSRSQRALAQAAAVWGAMKREREVVNRFSIAWPLTARQWADCRHFNRHGQRCRPRPRRLRKLAIDDKIARHNCPAQTAHLPIDNNFQTSRILIRITNTIYSASCDAASELHCTFGLAAERGATHFRKCNVPAPRGVCR